MHSIILGEKVSILKKTIAESYNNKLFFITGRKRLRLCLASSEIRKLLLESGQRNESLKEALACIADNAKARSAFFVDTDGEQYDYIKPDYFDLALKASEKYTLINCLVKYADNKKRDIFSKEITLNSSLATNDPELYGIMKSHKITNVVFTVIWDKNNHASVMGVLSSKRKNQASVLLSDIVMCFSITIYNRKYLSATEQAAITDSLTGLNNRMGFNRDMLGLRIREYSTLSCLYIDVNELHAHNNKYGHLAGDKMLMRVAEIIKNQFVGHKTYRWGGDEFIVFAENLTHEDVIERIEQIEAETEESGYHVSIGYSFADGKKNIETIINEAEKRMYEAKAKYYQDKARKAAETSEAVATISHVDTGNADVDAALSVISQRYYGIYAVNLEKNTARIILVSEAFDNILEQTKVFSEAMKIYVDSQVVADYHREFSSFMNYDIIKNILSGDINPRITYRKINDDVISLTVYRLRTGTGEWETLWVFEKE